VEAQVTSDKSFDASCPPRPATIGEATVINVFLFAYDAGDKKVTAGTDYDVTALTTGITGDMTVAGGAAIAINGDKWTYSPAATEAAGTKTVTITPTYDGVTFDAITFDITVYPSLEYTVKATTVTECGTLSYTFDTDLLNDIITDVTYTFYTTNNSGTLSGDVTDQTESITASTSYWVQSYNNYEYGDPKEIKFTINPAAAISTDLDDQTKVSKTVDTTTPPTENLAVTASSGTGITYQWYKSTTNAYAGTALTDDTAYAGVATADLTITFNTTAVTGFYYLVVTDGCGNEVRSKIKEVEAFNIPADVVLATGITSPKEYCGTVTSGDNLWDMIDHTDLTVTYHYNTTGATDAYTSEVNATTPVQLVGGTTYYLKAMNGAGGLSVNATELEVQVNADLGVTISASPATITVGNSLNLTATLTGTAPSGAKYEWYKGTTPSGAALAVTDAATYTKTSATAADAGSYCVVVTNNDGSVTGLCNNTSSNAATVTVLGVPANIALASGITSPKEYCGVVTSGDNLWDMIDHTDLAVTYHYNTTGATDAYTSEVNATTPVQLVGGTTYYLKANNGAGGLSATATELQVVVNTSVNAAIAFKDKITTSETIITPNSIVLKASGAATSGT
ncbi:hypothetical protein M2101_002492, partial [Parabacteroides sp. PM5-20]|uniref:Ig-like domain-containing protein n=1 Tax=Parabacteroides sp. PM5-20 TaxID=2940527 RepID=UPI0024735C94